MTPKDVIGAIHDAVKRTAHQYGCSGTPEGELISDAMAFLANEIAAAQETLINNKPVTQ